MVRCTRMQNQERLYTCTGVDRLVRVPINCSVVQLNNFISCLHDSFSITYCLTIVHSRSVDPQKICRNYLIACSIFQYNVDPHYSAVLLYI